MRIREAASQGRLFCRRLLALANFLHDNVVQECAAEIYLGDLLRRNLALLTSTSQGSLRQLFATCAL